MRWEARPLQDGEFEEFVRLDGRVFGYDYLPSDFPMVASRLVPARIRVVSDRGRIVGGSGVFELRPVDIAGLLSSRNYEAPGALTVNVEGDTYTLQADGSGKGHCERKQSADERAHTADIECTRAELGAVPLGGAYLRPLAAAGRIRARDEAALRRADALFRTARAPWTAAPWI